MPKPLWFSLYNTYYKEVRTCNRACKALIKTNFKRYRNMLQQLKSKAVTQCLTHPHKKGLLRVAALYYPFT